MRQPDNPAAAHLLRKFYALRQAHFTRCARSVLPVTQALCEKGISVSSDDWYRNESWDQKTEDFFFSKLSRARSQKSQYLKIQAYYLINSAPDVVLKLGEYFRSHCQDDFWEQELCLYESKAFYNMGKTSQAIVKVKDALNWLVQKPNIKTDAPYWYAELVLKKEISEEYKPSLEALKAFHYETPFPTTQFNYFSYLAILLNRLNETASAKIQAQEALAWANKDKNLLQNTQKQKLGLFKKNTNWPISEVQKIASQ